MPASESPYTFSLNGVPVTVSAFEDEPLLHVLRDRLSLTGTRHGCGLGQCGACRVVVDGRLAAACDTPIGSLAGSSVTTIEGLSSATAGRIREAFERVQAGQCGACLSGIIVTLCQVIDSGSACDEAALRAVLDDHLCRCGSHSRVVAAALSVVADGHWCPT